jgi:hypothetical protein
MQGISSEKFGALLRGKYSLAAGRIPGQPGAPGVKSLRELWESTDLPGAEFAIVVDETDEKAAVYYRNFGISPFPTRPLKFFMPAFEAAELFPARCLDSCRGCGL